MADDGLRIVSAPADDGLRIVEPPKPAPARTARGYEPLFSDPALQAMIEDAAETAGAGMEQMQRGLQTALTPGVSPFVQAARGGLDYGTGALGVLGSPFAPLVKPRADLAHEKAGKPTYEALEPVVGKDLATFAQSAIESALLLPDMVALGPEMLMRPAPIRSLPIERGIADRIAPAAESKPAAKPAATRESTAAAAPQFKLEPAALPADILPQHAANARAFTILDAEGKPAGYVRGSILDGVDGKFFNIDMIENTSGQRLPTRSMRDLLPQLQEQLPSDVRRINGVRVSGARDSATGAGWSKASIDLPERRGAAPREPTGYTLHEAPSSGGLTRFEVRDVDGKRVANVSGQRQGDAFFINSVAPEPGLVVEGTSIKPGEQIGPNDLGPAIVRDLQAQLLAKTGASRVTGERITGARAANTSNVPGQPGAPSAFQQKWAPFVEGMDKVNAEMRGILDTLNDIRAEASRPKSAGPGLEEGARAARENAAPEVPPTEPTQGKPPPASPEPLTAREDPAALAAYEQARIALKKMRARLDDGIRFAEDTPERLQALEEAVANPPRGAETRGAGQFYHGTSTPITSLHDYYGGDTSYYGRGLYTTDALDIGQGYSRKGRGGKPTVYRINDRGGKFFNMEEPISAWLGEWLRKSDDELIGAALEESPKNLRELFDGIRDASAYERVSAAEVQDVFDNISAVLQREGFDGLQHTGGLRTGKKPHTVRIYWTPEQHAALGPEVGFGRQAEPLTGEVLPTEAPLGPGHNNPPEALTADEPPPANFPVPAKRDELTTTDGGGKGGPPDITFGPRGAFDDGFGGGGGIAGVR